MLKETPRSRKISALGEHEVKGVEVKTKLLDCARRNRRAQVLLLMRMVNCLKLIDRRIYSLHSGFKLKRKILRIVS